MKPRITLTFDNGPTAEVTPHVLEVLDRYQIRATFFVLGKNLQSATGKNLVKLAADKGHWIGNHTFNHDLPFGENPDPLAAETEIGKTQELIDQVTTSDRLFRPFGNGGELGSHLFSRSVLSYLITHEYTCILWNSIPRDWADPTGWPEVALRQCGIREWSLIVLHDYDTGAMDRLEFFIRSALSAGFSFEQEFPPDCVAIWRGIPSQDLRPWTAGPAPTYP